MRALFNPRPRLHKHNAKGRHLGEVASHGRRLLGLTLDGRPLWAPKGHSLLLSANGGGKTTSGCLPWLFSFLCADPRPAVLVMDGKDGEIAAQCAPMIAKLGIPVAVIDDMNVLGSSYPYRTQLNPLGSVLDTFITNPLEATFATEVVNQAILPDPPGGRDRNQFWRDGPHRLCEFALHAAISRTPDLAVPGAVWSLLADPDLLKQAAELEADAGSGLLQILGRNVLDMMGTEYFPMHREAALIALKIFSRGALLHEAGANADTTHYDLIQQGAVVFLVGSQRYMSRSSSYFSLHLASFLDALYRGAGPLKFINDEFTNTPLKSFVDALTTIRGYGGEAHNIAQSRSEIEKKFGKLETQTIEDNALVKQWFGFSSFEEAERVSKSMGDSLLVQQGLSHGFGAMDKISGNLSLGRQRWMSAAQLMAMPPDQQLVWAKGVGFFVARKVQQNQIAPFCHHLAPNPLEGGVLPPDPQITLAVPPSLKGKFS